MKRITDNWYLIKTFPICKFVYIWAERQETEILNVIHATFHRFKQIMIWIAAFGVYFDYLLPFQKIFLPL